MDYYKLSLELHEKNKGKLSVESKVAVSTKEELSLAYTPGVAQPCKEIAKNPELVYTYTTKGNMVAVVSDGSAVLGLGNIGPLAAMPVMEGKAVLFKTFAGVDAVPVCLDTQDTDELVKIITALAPTYGGINLEDISAPRCFEIEKRVQEAVDIPVFHDDQHGTAIVVSAAVINAAKLVKKPLDKIKAVVNGAGSAGTAIVNMLKIIGVKNIVVCDINGILCKNDLTGLNPAMAQLAKSTNEENLTGTLADAMRGADLVVGVSAPKAITKEMVSTMAKDAIVLAMANPEPEIMPDLALEGGARIVGTGRSDFANQINNVLAFPGIFKGALSVRAKRINEKMKLAAAHAIANCVSESELKEDYIVPPVFKEGVADAVANAVACAWEDGLKG